MLNPRQGNDLSPVGRHFRRHFVGDFGLLFSSYISPQLHISSGSRGQICSGISFLSLLRLGSQLCRWLWPTSNYKPITIEKLY